MTLILKLLITAISHVIVGLWLYQGRVHNRHAIFHSDLIVFGLPALLALCAYTYFIRRELLNRLSAPPSTTLSLSLAVIPTILSSLVALYIAFNRYGT
jgi:hypothetical protein